MRNDGLMAPLALPGSPVPPGALLMLAVAACIAAGLSAAATGWLSGRRDSWIPIDRPNERSLHQRLIPRIGGLAIAFAVATGHLVTGGSWAILAWAGALCAISFVDDHHNLPVRIRLPLQLLAAAGVLYTIHPQAHPLLIALLWISIAWSTNLFNFMDGANGLATSSAMIGFAALSLQALMHGDVGLGSLAALIAAACAGFLPLNWTPARAFLGDAGSITLGFLIAVLGIQGWQQADWSLAFPVLVFAPFGADATLTLLRRMLRGEAFWRAHRSHYYQRLVLMGWSHSRVSLAYAGLALVCALVGLASETGGLTGELIGLAGVAVLLGLLAWRVDAHWRTRGAATRS
jgi:UDP-N-acetylmuramyl pentapeptide phosphotransferase/UDP-N-acetylglucosamine-1-phosphate transferase